MLRLKHEHGLKINIRNILKLFRVIKFRHELTYTQSVHIIYLFSIELRSAYVYQGRTQGGLNVTPFKIMVQISVLSTDLSSSTSISIVVLSMF